MKPSTPSPTLIYKKEGAIAWITLNRPAVYNSFNAEMMFALHDALDEAAHDSSVRVLVIRGEGKAFCAGQDLSEFLDGNQQLPDAKALGFDRIVEERYMPMVLKIAQLQKPVVAAVNGVAAGAGANLALACDVVVASSEASFIQAFSNIGLVPDSGGTYFLPRLVGRQRALAWMLLGDKISAIEAERTGMIYQCIEASAFEATVTALATRLSQMPTKALAYTKKLIQLSETQCLEDQITAEGTYQQKAGQTEDFAEGVSAFLEKRKPTFKGN
jgi:2-(1,2-epoxy-1,2-dihydrophenyl)acetyl-CoA isomerase